MSRDTLPSWPVGTSVVVVDDDRRAYQTTTRSDPWLLGGLPVVMIEGISGGFACERMTPATSTLPHFRFRREVRNGTYTVDMEKT